MPNARSVAGQRARGFHGSAVTTTASSFSGEDGNYLVVPLLLLLVAFEFVSFWAVPLLRPSACASVRFRSARVDGTADTPGQCKRLSVELDDYRRSIPLHVIRTGRYICSASTYSYRTGIHVNRHYWAPRGQGSALPRQLQITYIAWQRLSHAQTEHMENTQRQPACCKNSTLAGAERLRHRWSPSDACPIWSASAIHDRYGSMRHFYWPRFCPT